MNFHDFFFFAGAPKRMRYEGLNSIVMGHENLNLQTGGPISCTYKPRKPDSWGRRGAPTCRTSQVTRAHLLWQYAAVRHGPGVPALL